MHHGHVPAVFETGMLAEKVINDVARRPVVELREQRRRQPGGELRQGMVPRPGQVVEIVVHEPALVGGPVGGEKQEG